MRCALLLGLVACGRVAFDPLDDSGPGDGGGDTLADVAPLVCAPSYTLAFGTSRYRRSTVGDVWLAAEADCESDGGHLAVVDDAQENTFVINGSSDTWLGCSDHLSEGTFRSVTGPVVTTTIWDALEPNNNINIEDCVEVLANGLWNDVSCTFGPLLYVCECDGAPAAQTYCDTSTDSDCGQCGTTCSGAQVCMNQACI